jgi:hypothetical protein
MADQRHGAAMPFQVLSYYRASIARAKQDLNREGEKEAEYTRRVARREKYAYLAIRADQLCK